MTPVQTVQAGHAEAPHPRMETSGSGCVVSGPPPNYPCQCTKRLAFQHGPPTYRKTRLLLQKRDSCQLPGAVEMVNQKKRGKINLKDDPQHKRIGVVEKIEEQVVGFKGRVTISENI